MRRKGSEIKLVLPVNLINLRRDQVAAGPERDCRTIEIVADGLPAPPEVLSEEDFGDGSRDERSGDAVAGAPQRSILSQRAASASRTLSPSVVILIGLRRMRAPGTSSSASESAKPPQAQADGVTTRG
jgi:hypothetical protein